MSLVSTPADQKNFSASSWEHVSKAKPCRICGKTDWCARRGTIELCRREERPGCRRKTDRSGVDYYLYGLGASSAERDVEATEREVEEQATLPAAADDVLDLVYRRLIDLCPLTAGHQQLLADKGLTGDAIKADLYGSWPYDESAQRHVMGTLLTDLRRQLGDRQAVETIFSVPGFYRREMPLTLEQQAAGITKPRVELALATEHGIIHPVCNRDGQVVAMQIRAEDGAYYWLSSARHGGPGARRVPHYPPGFPRPIGSVDVVRVVESTRAANIATRATSVLTIGLSSVAAWQTALPEIRDLGAKTVIIANDADARTSKGVSGSTKRFADALTKDGYDVALERWSPTAGKGLDDVITNGQVDGVERLTGAAVWRFIRDVVRSSSAPRDPVVEARLVLSSLMGQLTDEPSMAARSEVYQAMAALDETSAEYQRISAAVKRALKGGFTEWRKGVDEARRRGKKTRDREDAIHEGRVVVEFDDHVTLAKHVIGSLSSSAMGTKHIDRLVADEGHIYQARELVFEPVRTEVINAEIHALSRALVVSTGQSLHVNAGDVAGIRKTVYEQVERTGFFADAPRGIAFHDRFVAVDLDGNVTVSDLTREHRARWRYPFGYQPGAVPTETIRELRNIWQHRDDAGRWVADEDVDAKIALIQEFAGVSFLGYAPKFKSAIWATSTQRDSAKSTVGQLIAGNAPKGSVSSVSPVNWTDQQSLAQMAGKLFNFVDELPTRGMMNAAQFKYVINGAQLEAKEVYRTKFSFAPVAGQYHGVNGFWRPDEAGDAVLGKIIPLEYGRRFERHEMRLDLVDHLVTNEGAAFVSWAIEGAVRALRAKALTVPASSLAMRDKWSTDSSAVRQWIADEMTEVETTAIHGIEDETKLLDLPTAYESYKTWYERNHADGRRAVGSKTLSNELQEMGLAYRTRHTKTVGLNR